MQRSSRVKKVSKAEEALQAIAAAKAGSRSALDDLDPDGLEDVELDDASGDEQHADDDEFNVPAKRKASASGSLPFQLLLCRHCSSWRGDCSVGCCGSCIIAP
jgi:hypothetical protein